MSDTPTPTEPQPAPKMTAMQFPDIPNFEFHAPEGTSLQQACDVLLKMASIIAIASATASGSWGAITHIGLRDASTAGNQLFFGALSGTVNVGSGGKFNVAAGDIDIVLA